jgi:hypothetical protein
MAKKITTPKTTAAPAANTEAPLAEAAKAPSLRAPTPATATAPATLAKPKAAKKTAAPKTAAKAPARKTKPIVRAGFSNDDVALRAYYIAEKRQAQGHPGDTHSDWIEAERQLRHEHGAKA